MEIPGGCIMYAFVVVIVLSIATISLCERSTLDLEEDVNKIELDCSQFEKIIECHDPAPRWIAAGSFGQAWLVKEKRTGDEVVLKIFYTKETSPPKYLTSADVLGAGTDSLSKQIAGARKECELARKLQEGSNNPFYSGKGQQRIMNCYGHNLDAGLDDTTPLYLMLENCGKGTLLTYHASRRKKGTWNFDTIMLILKQILEGLEFLQNFDREYVYMHHDLKPENIAIKEVVDLKTGEIVPIVNLIDMGAVMRHKRRGVAQDACVGSTGTVWYAPMEWKSPSPNVGSCKKYAFHPSYPAAFDMYAVGAMLLEMTFSRRGRMPSLLTMYLANIETQSSETVWIDLHKLLNHRLIWSTVKSRYFIGTMAEIWMMDPDLPNYLKGILGHIETDHSVQSFYQKVLKCLAADAWERPTARDLLEDRFMRRIPPTPDENAGPKRSEVPKLEAKQPAVPPPASKRVESPFYAALKEPRFSSAAASAQAEEPQVEHPAEEAEHARYTPGQVVMRCLDLQNAFRAGKLAWTGCSDGAPHEAEKLVVDRWEHTATFYVHCRSDHVRKIRQSCVSSKFIF